MMFKDFSIKVLIVFVVSIISLIICLMLSVKINAEEHEKNRDTDLDDQRKVLEDIIKDGKIDKEELDEINNDDKN